MSIGAFREIFACDIDTFRKIVQCLPNSEKPEVLAFLQKRAHQLSEV